MDREGYLQLTRLGTSERRTIQHNPLELSGRGRQGTYEDCSSGSLGSNRVEARDARQHIVEDDRVAVLPHPPSPTMAFPYENAGLDWVAIDQHATKSVLHNSLSVAVVAGIGIVTGSVAFHVGSSKIFWFLLYEVCD
jgi:hypothetical protein